MKMINKSELAKLGVLVAVIVGIVLIFKMTSLSVSDFTPANVKNFILEFDILAPFVFILVYSLRAIILVLPVGVMSLAGGLAFGKWLGTVYILIGATIGSCISFLVARHFGRSFIEKMGWINKGRIKSFDEGTEKNGFRFILFIRLVPLFQYDAVNFGSGLSKMKLRDYALGSFIGMAPGGFINALLGSSLENILSVQFFAALGIFILLMFIPAIYKAFKKKKVVIDIDRKSEENRNQTEKVKKSTGECPVCGKNIGPMAVLVSWDNWGRFVCPGCEKRIHFRGWLLSVIVLIGLLIGIERLLNIMLVSKLPLWLSFFISFVLAILMMFFIPMIWRFEKEKNI